MIVVLEGPDGSGKTTLARRLAAKHDLEYVHVGPPTPEQLADDDSLLRHYARLVETRRTRNVVFDRLALGERVYGPIFRGRDGLGPHGWRVFRRLLSGVRAIQVLCLPRFEACKGAWSSGREEMLKREDQFAASYWSYSSMRGEADLVHDWEREGSDAEVSMAISGSDLVMPLPPGAVGSPTPSLLIVGEKDDASGLPFFSTGGEAAWLSRALDAAGWCEHEVAFINAYDRHGQQRVLPWQQAQTAALGTEARLACCAQGINALWLPRRKDWMSKLAPDAFVEALREIRRSR